MEITSLGHASFKIRGKSVTVVTDPFDPKVVGLAFPKHVSADIITISHAHPDHNAAASIEGTPFVVSGPGEYEVHNVSIIGISTFHDDAKGEKLGRNTMYHMEMEGVNIAHLGDLGHMLSSAEIEKLDGVDILFIGVGGGEHMLSPKDAATLVGEIEPKVVIPMHYKTDKHDEKTFGSLESLSVFLKEMGKEAVQPVPKFVTTKDKLPQEMQVIVLE
jgi:L-ascorbate metabolism protein UlaG (beta-lactamase superfamily)